MAFPSQLESEEAEPIPDVEEIAPQIDYSSPKVQAELKRRAEMKNIIEAPDPFAVLATARNEKEIDSMLLTVRNHKMHLEGKREAIYEQAIWEDWEYQDRRREVPDLTEGGKPRKKKELVRDETGEPIKDADGAFVFTEVPVMTFEEYKERVKVTKTGARQTGKYKPLPPEIVAEIEKWDQWIKEAKARMKPVVHATNPFA